MHFNWRFDGFPLLKIFTGIAILAPMCSWSGSLPASESVPHVSQTLQEVSLKTDETAKLLAKELMTQGRFQSPSESERQKTKRILDAIRGENEQQLLPQLLLAEGGFNGSGGGGGLACFSSPEEAEKALDRAGRLNRNFIAKIRDFENFDTFRIIYRDPRRWEEASNGNRHLRMPLKGEQAEAFLRRVLYKNLIPFFPLLVERLIAFLERYPFSSWEAISGKGLPKYPDLDDELLKDLQTEKNPCVYVQLAIRLTEKPAKKTYFVYDKDLIDFLHGFSADEIEYQHKLAVLILHEATYFLAKELGAPNANQIYRVLEAALFEDADIDQAKDAFFHPDHPSLDYVNQQIGLLFEKHYERLLAEEPSISPWPSKLTLFRAWLKMVRIEKRALQEQEHRGCLQNQCMSGGGALWRYLFNNPSIVAKLSPAEAYFALAPSLSVNNVIPSPEALVSRSIDPRPALTFSCQQISFDPKTTEYSMHSQDHKLSQTLSREVGKILFSKIHEFCKPALP